MHQRVDRPGESWEAMDGKKMHCEPVKTGKEAYVKIDHSPSCTNCKQDVSLSAAMTRSSCTSACASTVYVLWHHSMLLELESPPTRPLRWKSLPHTNMERSIDRKRRWQGTSYGTPMLVQLSWLILIDQGGRDRLVWLRELRCCCEAGRPVVCHPRWRT